MVSSAETEGEELGEKGGRGEGGREGRGVAVEVERRRRRRRRVSRGASLFFSFVTSSLLFFFAIFFGRERETGGGRKMERKKKERERRAGRRSERKKETQGRDVVVVKVERRPSLSLLSFFCFILLENLNLRFCKEKGGKKNGKNTQKNRKALCYGREGGRRLELRRVAAVAAAPRPPSKKKKQEKNTTEKKCKTLSSLSLFLGSF